jgi:transketolase
LGTESHGAALLVEMRAAAKHLRLKALEMIHRAGSGHPGGSLSAADILAVLYFHHLRVNPKRPDWPERDRFVASKGHCAPALYAALAARGFLATSELEHFRQFGGILQGHPDMNKTPGVDMGVPDVRADRGWGV